MDQERQDKERQERDAFNFESWGHAGASGTVKTPMMQPAPIGNALASGGSRPISRPPSAVDVYPMQSISAKTASWAFDDLLAPERAAAPSQAKSSSPLPVSKSQDPWDMAIFDSELPSTNGSRMMNGNAHSAAAEEDDVLGLLSKPIEQDNTVKVQKVGKLVAFLSVTDTAQ